MNISSQINVVLDSAVKKTGIGQAPLKPGDTLRLRVLEVLGNHRVVADFGKFRANAEITFPVQRGEEFMVKVVETGRQLRFSVLQPGLTPGEAASRFSDLFNILSDTRDLAKLKAAVDSLLNEINNQQSLAVKKHLHPDPFQVLTFLLPLKENDQHAKVKFYYPKKQNGAAKNGFKISILLNMDAMGEIRADLFLLNKELTITFFVRDDVNKQAIESHYLEINTALNNVVEYLVLRTVVSSKKISDFHREDWGLAEDKRVDVRI